MKSFKILKTTYSILAAILIVGCQQPGQLNESGGAGVFSSLDEGAVIPVDDSLPNEGGVPNNDDDVAGGTDDPNDPDDSDADRSLCGLSFNSAQSVDLAATDDASLINKVGNITVSNSVRNLLMDKLVGNFEIKSAINVSLSDFTGNLSLNASNISKIQDVRGNVCISAKTVGAISNGVGNTHIKAETIESINVQTGNLHVYGATIKVAKAFTGNICLHDGAKILNLSDSIGNIGECK